MVHTAEASWRGYITHRVVMLGFDGSQMLDIAGPLEVFARTSRWLETCRGHKAPAYSVELVAAEAGSLAMSNGLTIGVSRSIRDVDHADTLLVTGGIGWEAAAADPAIARWLRTMALRADRFGSICTGSLVLGAVGLLKDQRATTHWAYLDLLAEIEPTCAVDRNAIYVRSGNLFTSAGVTAGIDMALALVEADYDRRVALDVAQELVVYRRRPGDQAQLSRHLAAELRDSPFAPLERWILDNLASELTVSALAAQIGLCERQFARRFTAEIGCAPAKWVRTVRLEEAQRQLEQGASSLKLVARRCGYVDEQALRRAFQRTLGVLPSDYAAQFGHG